MEGIVKFWSKKGFGFIESPELKEDIFVHYSNIVSNDEFKFLNNGDSVNFEVINQNNGKIKAGKVFRN